MGRTLDRLTVAYAQWLVRHSYMVVLLTLALLVFACVGLKDFVLNNHYSVYFDEDEPLLTEYEAVQAEYTKDDTLFFVVTAKSGEVFDRRVLEAVAYLTEEAWKLPYAVRVDSVTNYHHAWAEGDELLVQPLVAMPASMTDEELLNARSIAYREPMLANRLVKPGSPVTGINVVINIHEEIPRVSMAITAAAEKLMAEAMTHYPEVDIRLTGLVPLNNAFLTMALHDLSTLTPLMTVIILFTMAFLLKSVLLTLSVAMVVLFSSFSTMGILCWMGYEVAGDVKVLPLIVLTLAVANCIHILVSLQSLMRQGVKKDDAIVESMRINMVPVFITSITTAIGFLCMNVNPAPTLRMLGNFTALGVLIAFLLAILFLPALAHILPFHVPRKTTDDAMRSAMQWIGEFVIKYKTLLIISILTTTLLISLNIPFIRVNNQFVEFFEKRVPIRRDTEYAMEHLTGIYQLVFNVPAGKTDGVNEPEYLQHLDNFAGWAARQDGVVHVHSIVATIKRMNQAMHGDDPALYRVPESRELAAQYLLLYEMSLPSGVDLNTEVNMDKSATRMIITTRNLNSEGMGALIARVEAWEKEHLPEEMFAPALGPAVLFTEVSRSMMESMAMSAPLALLLVSLCMFVALKSVKYGLISLVPNLIPLGLGFGIWGFFQWDINFGMTTIVSMSIGIIVDDTVHFLSKYLRARREFGLSPEEGVRYVFASVGKAMWVTSFILVAGFSIMNLSEGAYNSNMGTLVSMIIIAALVGDFLLLPPILLIADKKRWR